MPPALDDKRTLRHEVLSRRDALGIEARKQKDESIRKQLSALTEFAEARTILLYASFKSEVDTFELLKESISKHKTIVLPKVDMKNSSLTLYEICSLEDLSAGCYGILEPRAAEDRIIDPAAIDVMIIPGVAFDEQCNRLGYGKGFYDRLLSRKKVPALALAYEEQILRLIPAEEHDIKMDKIITDKRIIHRHEQ
ncbi:MAG: 5-formyltetrahydrofolate cyclo-ligase [Nitrospirae bacterium]|nr:5-formyltetrahydrofolate cyclo-ligase [Nitrospirota bacterium]